MILGYFLVLILQNVRIYIYSIGCPILTQTLLVSTYEEIHGVVHPAVLRYLLEKVRVTKIDKQEPFVVHGDIQGRDDRNDQIWP
jgi:hypothetical protein